MRVSECAAEAFYFERRRGGEGKKIARRYLDRAACEKTESGGRYERCRRWLGA